jgi:hypothetical protein
MAQLKRSLKDAAAINAARDPSCDALGDTGFPVEASSGGRTKRSRISTPKTLEITADGRGAYRRTHVNGAGFPRGCYTRNKLIRAG